MKKPLSKCCLMYFYATQVSQTFRDALGSYRSSSNCKKERRKLERARAYAEAEMRNAKRPKLNKDSPLASFSLPQQMQPLPALPSLAVKTNPDPAVPTESRMLDVLATILPSDYEQDPNPLEPNQIMDSNSISQDPTLQQQTQQQLHYSYDADIFEPASIYEPSAYDAFHPSPVPSNVDWSRFLCNAKSIDDSGGNHEGRRRNGFLGIKQPSQPNIRYATSA